MLRMVLTMNAHRGFAPTWDGGLLPRRQHVKMRSGSVQRVQQPCWYVEGAADSSNHCHRSNSCHGDKGEERRDADRRRRDAQSFTDATAQIGRTQRMLFYLYSQSAWAMLVSSCVVTLWGSPSYPLSTDELGGNPAVSMKQQVYEFFMDTDDRQFHTNFQHPP